MEKPAPNARCTFVLSSERMFAFSCATRCFPNSSHFSQIRGNGAAVSSRFSVFLPSDRCGHAVEIAIYRYAQEAASVSLGCAERGERFFFSLLAENTIPPESLFTLVGCYTCGFH